MNRVNKLFLQKGICVCAVGLLFWFVVNLLTAYGVFEDPMRKYIPDELTAQRKIKTVSHASFPGGGATVSVYKLDTDSIHLIQSNSSYFQDWDRGHSGCISALVFLRDIGNRKDKKLNKYIGSGSVVYSLKNALVVPDKGLIVTCSANW